MNRYRFKIKDAPFPMYMIQRFPHLEAAKQHAKENDYSLMKHSDPDAEFYSANFKKDSKDESND